ncbi:hypothetical protein Tco_0085623 [Tanacetum coccineum]
MGSRNQNSLQSKFDQTSKISKSVFVSNFPDGCNYRDIWKVCNDYGTYCGGCCGFFPTRNQRLNATPIQKGVLGSNGTSPSFRQPKIQDRGGSYVHVVNGNNLPPVISPSPAMVLDDSCVVSRNLDLFILGETKNTSSITNLYILLSNEGFHNVKLSYLGGLWVMIEMESLNSKEKLMQHAGIASWFNNLGNAQVDFVSRECIVWVDIEGKVFMIRAKELFMWSPTFKVDNESKFFSDEDSTKDSDEANGGEINKVSLRIENKEYRVSLISVHKVAKDSKFVVAFDESHCYVFPYNLREMKLLGIGKQNDGLYYFDGKQGNILGFEKTSNDKFSSRSEKCVLVMYSSFKNSSAPSDNNQDLTHINFFDEASIGDLGVPYDVNIENHLHGSNGSAGENEIAATSVEHSSSFEGINENIPSPMSA